MQENKKDSHAAEDAAVSQSIDGKVMSQQEQAEMIFKESIQNNSALRELIGNGENSTQSFVPNAFVQSQDKISTTLVEHPVINAGEQELQMEGRGSNVPITTKISVSLDLENLGEDSKIHIAKKCKFTYFEKAILDSVYTLWVAGNHVITLHMIAKAMTGRSGQNYHASSSLSKEISNSLFMLANTRLRIDLTEEANAFNLKFNKQPNTQSFMLNENILNIRYITSVINGQKVDAIEILSKPILNVYAALRGQVISIPMEILDSPVNKSQDAIAIQEYLIHRIESMKRNKNLKRTILFETLFSCVDSVEEATNASSRRSKKNRLRNITINILNYWVKINYIKGFQCMNKDSKAEGTFRINFELYPPSKK